MLKKFVLILVGIATLVRAYEAQVENTAVTKFREYLRIPTNHPNPDEGYQQAIKWLTLQAQEMDLDVNLVEVPKPGLFALILTWNGTDSQLPSVLLNSHMDVVAVDPNEWIHTPFEAFKDDDGNIWARGACDMKSATVAELEAIRRLKQSGFLPLRTIHLTILPDEEIGSTRGMQAFVESEDFRNLNVGFDLDEGGTNPSSQAIDIIYGEKSAWQFNITAHGMAGHGATLPEFTAGQRLQVVIDRLLKFRQDQFEKIQRGEATFEDVTTINLVEIGGGIADNIIPGTLWAVFDMRIRVMPNFGFNEAEDFLNKTIEAARLGSKDDPNNRVEIDFISKSLLAGQTPVNNSNSWWTAVQMSCAELNVTCPPTITFAITDGRFARQTGIPTFGIGPFLNTPFTGHQANEVINEREFLAGIDRYYVFIRNLSRLPGKKTHKIK